MTSPTPPPTYTPYFIVFTHPAGVGNTSLSLRAPIRSLDDVRAIEKHISETNGFHVCVTSWQRFETEER
ncbi:hypothetical protein ACFFWC_24625 [Plantactinospora siamensis]|uniref:Uncharacterized protein n=1 Tax=Plantactinospora siamensis TaxID=555372 RepID=A0ABV6P6G8_9ACTN